MGSQVRPQVDSDECRSSISWPCAKVGSGSWSGVDGQGAHVNDAVALIRVSIMSMPTDRRKLVTPFTLEPPECVCAHWIGGLQVSKKALFSECVVLSALVLPMAVNSSAASQALIRRMSPENEARLELEALEKEYERLNVRVLYPLPTLDL